MKLVLKPSLEHMTIVKIAVSLWNQNDIRDLIAQLNFSQDSRYRRQDSRYRENVRKESLPFPLRKQWEKIEERVIKKVPQLSLPKLLEDKMCIIKSIGLQILKWMVFHHSDFMLLLNQPAEFCWTPQGILDGKKTAEMLVKDENLDIPTRYKLACIYCLEDDINKFWNKQTAISYDVSYDIPIINDVSYDIPIVIFWTCNMLKIRNGNAHINYKYEFNLSVDCGNKVAAGYLLQKLTLQERERYLIESAKSVNDAYFLYFLLTKMNDEEQMEVFKSVPCKVLRYFLEWPLQNFFLEIANCMWDFLAEEDFDFSLKRIIIKASEKHKDWNYKKMFRKFWLKSPACLKSLIIDKLDKTRVLESLFIVKDKESTNVILKDLTLTEKKNIIYQVKTCHLLKRCIIENEWDFLEFFIRECLSSKTELQHYKEYFIPQCLKDDIVVDIQEWDKLFGLPDDPIKCKQKCVEGESSSSKRFCK